MRIIGKFTYWGSGLLLFLFWIGTLMDWLGGIFGFLLGIILSPGLVVFPFVYWIVEGIFPINYFIIWGIGIVGLIVASISETSNESV
jgi:hypothetical protein